MKIYEVYAEVAYYDPDANIHYRKQNGTFFNDKSVALTFMHKMAESEEKNLELSQREESRYYGIPDYQDDDNDTIVYVRYDDIDESDRRYDLMKYNNIIEVAYTYHCNIWHVREIEVITTTL